MIARHRLLGWMMVTASGLAGCGDDVPPRLRVDATVTPRDDGSQPPTDQPITPTDAGPTTDVSGIDGSPVDIGRPADDIATTDTGIAPTDTGTPPGDGGTDVPRPPMQRLCGFSERQINALAVRLATCLRRPPQELLNELWRPDYWEGGPIARRACPALAACAANANMGCASIMGDCLKYVVNPAEGACPSPAMRCQATFTADGGMAAGDRFATTCGNNLEILDDCPATGRRCVSSSIEAVCVQMGAATCTPGSPPRCDNGVLLRCQVGVYVAVKDCNNTGSACSETANECIGVGEACTGDATDCDGTRLRRCVGGRYQSYDCGSLVTGSTCQRRGNAAFCGFRTECDPTAATTNVVCTGNQLAACAAGTNYTFDCVAAGFRGCTATGCTP